MATEGERLRALYEHRLSGFAVERMTARFLPFTTKGRLPSGPSLVRWYLRVPLAWRILGQQSFAVARKDDPT